MPGIRAGLDRGSAPFRWAAHNLLIALACAAAAFALVALANAAGLRAGDAEPIDGGEYVFTLFLSAVWLWPVYMLALLLLGRRGRFRLWAFALSPVLLVGMSIAVASLENPELQAALLACVLFAAAVTPPPGARTLKSTP